MRVLALSLICLSVIVFQNQKTISSQALALAANPKEQTANILFQSTDDGKSWQDVSRGLPDTLQVTRILTQDGELFLGTENGGLYHSSHPGMGVWEHENVGEFFASADGTIPNKIITGIFPGRSGPYVCVLDGGCFRKITNTGLWQPMHEAMKEQITFAVLERPDGTILTSYNSGIYKSEDDGKTWKRVFAKGWVTNFVAAGDVIVANSSQGLLRSTDNGEHWENALFDESGMYNISVIGGRIVAARIAGSWLTYTEGLPLLITSADGGATWERVDGGPTLTGIYDLEEAGEYLFCSHKAGISRSSDGGKTWELVRPFTSADENEFLNLAVSGKTVFAVKMRAGC